MQRFFECAELSTSLGQSRFGSSAQSGLLVLFKLGGLYGSQTTDIKTSLASDFPFREKEKQTDNPIGLGQTPRSVAQTFQKPFLNGDNSRLAENR
jgi:hypothetical protein